MDIALAVSAGFAVTGLVLALAFLPRTNAPQALRPTDTNKEAVIAIK
jgi:hypothetical protein